MLECFLRIFRPSSMVRYIIYQTFSGVLEKLVSSGRLAGTIQGRLDKAVFIPDIYTQTLNAWISSIFQQDGYIGKLFSCIYKETPKDLLATSRAFCHVGTALFVSVPIFKRPWGRGWGCPKNIFDVWLNMKK